MSNEIKEELLKQMHKDSQHKSIKPPQEIIARDTARVKRLKWITVFSWLLVVTCYIIYIIIVFLENIQNSNTITGAYIHLLLYPLLVISKILPLIAIILTISLYIRARTLATRKIHMRLANIEELLKKLSQAK
jgi:hypothetical protein